MSNIRVSPNEPNPTHHIALVDREGRKLGLILSDDSAQPARQFSKNPVETTAQKQTSGASSYDAFDYPYSPVVQDDWSGGRANKDFERDSTRFLDSYRAKTGRSNVAFAGPQERFISGTRSVMENVPAGSGVMWRTLTNENRYIYRRFQIPATGGFSAQKLWILSRIKGQPAELQIELRADAAGAVGNVLANITVTTDSLNDVLSEWINEIVSTNTYYLNGSTFYWLVIYAQETDNKDSNWMIGVKNATGSTYYSADFTANPTVANFDLYFRITPVESSRSCVMFEYQEQQYFILNPESGTPQLFMAGDRGCADPNTGQLSRLNDSTKTGWANMTQAGGVVVIIDGPGKDESQPWRTITKSYNGYCYVDADWKIEHTINTVYVILNPAVTEITGHGLTAPVTDVLVTTTGIVLFAQGDNVNIRRMREYNNAGTWTREFADDGTNKAVFLKYKPQAKKIVKANNTDSNGDVSIALADPVAWATASHTFGTAVPIDSKYRKINNMIVYPDTGGNEAVWVMKTDIPYIAPGSGNPYPINLPEMRNVRSPYNGRAVLAHGVYLLWSLQQGLERFYGSQIDDIGPNLDEGLPTNRRGPIVSMLGYPGKFFVAIDAGSTGYSSIMDSDGWHERYRAPKSQRIGSLGFQVVPGPQPDRLWFYQGNDLMYLPFPSDTANELEDVNYPYTHEYAITLSRMHAGMFDVQKLIKLIKLQSENLQTDATGESVTWFELDYRTDDASAWTTIDTTFTESPTQSVDLTGMFGLVGKRLQLRVRGYTTDPYKSPVLVAVIVSAVLRTDVKYMYPMQFRLMDYEPLLAAGEQDNMKATSKLKMLEDWADSSTKSMLRMESISPLFHGRVIFLNPPTTRQILYRDQDGNEFKRDVLICTASAQEA